MFVPPVQAHVDAIIFTDTVDTHHLEIMDEHHEQEHHKNDSDEHKEKNHHHHCTSLGFSSAVIAPLNMICNLIGVIKESQPIHYYQKSFLSNYLDTLLEPPQV